MLVLDAGIVIRASTREDGLARFGNEELVAPPIMWSEARSALHEASWRGEVPAPIAREANARLDALPISTRRPRGFGREAWRIADELGWAKTYDAEYLALASLLGCRFVTLDARLRRGADRLGFVVSPTEL
jgi:predicted nucleic acid-binding protein